MAHPPPSGSVVLMDWYRSVEGKGFFSRIKRKEKRRIFGLLEAPPIPPLINVDTVRYKVFLSGKSGVGKTALAARLAGLDVSSVHYETIGIQTSVVFWPVKLRDSGQVLLFRLHLWDCGENALRRFDHLLPTCKEQLDAVLFLFSFTDHSSFDDLPGQIARGCDPSDNVVKLVVGTKFDLFMHTDVTEREVKAFQEQWAVPVFCIGGDACDDLQNVAPLLNTLAELLWHQDCVTVGAVPANESAVGDTSSRAGH
ncbi:ciliogenesis and planar polarity effector 2 [Paramormyrops kingsleyae]|uniref:Ciliogenesis and planar polarity effector 2 n=1 Tax=Paramormyrops kingsleyae TaxID=1676925 RepID=A0A3B3R8E7_9TELE|nr:REM2- and Rab-like small GTPase 1 [Paramormyrops kingsleyae]